MLDYLESLDLIEPKFRPISMRRLLYQNIDHETIKAVIKAILIGLGECLTYLAFI